jgi:hypothetical protein
VNFVQEPPRHPNHFVLFDLDLLLPTNRAAEYRVPPQQTDAFSQRFGIVRLNEDAAAHDFRDCGCARDDDWLSGRHYLQKGDSEPLLYARQAENIRTIVLAG